LKELPALMLGERQELNRRAIELDEEGLSSHDQALVAERFEEQRHNPESVLKLEERKARVCARTDG
jgi:hypothetical protein